MSGGGTPVRDGRLRDDGAAASLAASPVTSSPDVCDVEAALQVFEELLVFISNGEFASIASVGDIAAAADQRQRWRNALSTLSCSVPLNGMLADTLLERVTAAFAVHLRIFQNSLQQRQQRQPHGKHTTAGTNRLPNATLGPALETLCASYERMLTFLREWCSTLRVPGVAGFLSVRVRCALLQADLLSGEEPRGKRAFLACLRQHGHELLSRGPRWLSGSSSSCSGAEEDEEMKVKSESHRIRGPPGRSVVDPVIACLHRLTLNQSKEMKQLWRSVIEERIREKLRDLSDDFSTHFLREQMTWLEQCVIPFVAMVLDAEKEKSETRSGSQGLEERSNGSGLAATDNDEKEDASLYVAARAERETWCADMRHLFLYSYARRRLESFWEILSDYPDSIPALEDMHYCLQSNPESDLKTELIQTVRHLLSSRLHRAGTRTEDILAILVNTIHAFCVLVPRNEQNSVIFAVIADTLEHLRKRKDYVTAIVQAVMQPNSVINAAAAAAAPPPKPLAPLPAVSTLNVQGEHITHGGADMIDFPDGVNGTTVSGDGLRGEELYRTGSRDRPDVLRVLLTSIHRRALVEEYQQVLAEQLLQKPMHEFDTTPEEEVLERLKQVFGETVLDKCAVMVRDMQMSRRITQQLREQLARRRGVAPRGGVAAPGAVLLSSSSVVMPVPSSVSVLSMTTWPPLACCSALPTSDGAGVVRGQTSPLKYRPHPSLQAEMDALAEAYKQLKDNQRLAWLPSLGRVELEWTQRDPAKGNALVTVSRVLSLFDASLVLFVKELASSTDQSGRAVSSGVSLSELATALDITADEVRPHVQRLSPTVLIMPTSNMVAMQLNVAVSSDFMFAEDTATSEAGAKPVGLPPERLKLIERMVTSLLKTRGPQAAAAIHNSLKLLAKFEGTNADLVELLHSFMERGLIVVNDAKLYALPST